MQEYSELWTSSRSIVSPLPKDLQQQAVAHLLDSLRLANNVKVLNDKTHADIPKNLTVVVFRILEKGSGILGVEIASHHRTAHISQTFQLIDIGGNIQLNGIFHIDLDSIRVDVFQQDQKDLA